MKNGILFCRLLCIFSSLLYTFTSYAKGKFVIIKNVNIIDVEHSNVKQNQNVIIGNGKIISITSNNDQDFSHYSGAEIVKGKDLYLSPGLIDMHVHMDLWHYGVLADDWALPLFIANGITSIRDAAGSELTLKMRDNVRKGSIIGPRMFIATPFLTSEDVVPDSNAFSAKSPVEVRQKLKEYFSKGYDFVKTNNIIEKSVFEAAVKFSESQGKYVMGHALASVDSGYAKVHYDQIFSSYRTIEHSRWFLGDYLQSEQSPYFHTSSLGLLLWRSLAYADFSKLPSLIKKFQLSDLVLTPTTVPVVITDHFTQIANDVKSLGLENFQKHPRYRYLPDYVYNDWVDIIDAWGTNPQGEPEFQQAYKNEEKVFAAMDKAGIPLLLGTDIPARPTMVHGFSFHDEIDNLKKAGVSNYGIMKGATVNAAKALGKENELGTVEVGKLADLVLTKENPLNNLKALAHPVGVITRGIFYSRSDLDQILKDVEKNVRSIKLDKRLVLNPEAVSCGSASGKAHKH